MNPTRPKSGAQPRRQWVCPQAAAPAAILLRRKLLINKHYSRCSSFSRLINTNIRSCTQGSAGTYAHVYKELARHPAEPAEPAGILSYQRDRGRRLVATHHATCWPYHHFVIEAAHSSFARLLERIWLVSRKSLDEGCAIEPLSAETITSKVTRSLPPAPVPLQHPYERRTSTSLNPFRRTSRRAVGRRPNRTLHHRFGSSLV
jgi:hypothetical protein